MTSGSALVSAPKRSPGPRPVSPEERTRSRRSSPRRLRASVSQQSYDAVKNVLDRIVAFCLLVLLSPFFLLTALVVMWDSPGSPLYTQWRRGRNQQPFLMYKFRTMEPDAHQKRDSLLELNDVDGIIFKMKSDPRVTKCGRFLRKFSLDEFPQLLNVLRGEMSLVGPRPFSKEIFSRICDDALYSTWVSDRHSVLPGMTGLWQVRGRNDLPFKRLMRLDLVYVRDRSFLLDITILLKTLSVMWSGLGAY